MDFYTLTAIKFALGILTMIFQINILGKRDFSLNTPLNQVQNYVLGGIIGGVIYNSSITLLQFLIIILIWSLVAHCAKVGLTAQSLSRSLRDQGISSVADVEAAVMETNGSLTIRVRGAESTHSLLPLVSDGQLVPSGLTLVGRDAAWVKEQLKAQGYSAVKQVFLAELIDGQLEIVPFSKAARPKA